LSVGVDGDLDLQVRRADISDLPGLIEFTLAEAREAEGAIKAPTMWKRAFAKLWKMIPLPCTGY